MQEKETIEYVLQQYRIEAGGIHDFFNVICVISIVVFVLFEPSPPVKIFGIALSSALVAINATASYGLKKGKKWAVAYSTIIAVILLFIFPLGTLCGYKLLYYYSRKEWVHKARP